jgi:hypothetical protein
VGLVTAYAAGFRQRQATLTTAGVLAVVYGFVFVVLHLQDYALLVGSLGLAVVRFLSRNINCIAWPRHRWGQGGAAFHRAAPLIFARSSRCTVFGAEGLLTRKDPFTGASVAPAAAI